ncbi:MAG: class I SAM-dependent methyltransferase [Spirochaetia bacterium]|jgi:ubiquinone/menaquinone biosynthesis C-methylase UbiE|nr:class I SAM-dependent methyltransferase [Spirochaetia bacterium]
MNERMVDVQRFLEYCFLKQYYIEPPGRAGANSAHLLDVINTYSPEIIIKAGVGSGALLVEMAKTTKSRIVVVDPSISIIRKFIKNYGSVPEIKDISFVAGDFNGFPIDYYAADMIIAIDNISFIESSSAIDEFRRALQFEGILYISTPVLSTADEEGVFDDYMRMLFPLHNEFYMEDELKTVMELNEFNLVKGNTESFSETASEQAAFFGGLYDDRSSECAQFIDSRLGLLASCYGFNNGSFSLPYYSGVFRRVKTDDVYEKR